MSANALYNFQKTGRQDFKHIATAKTAVFDPRSFNKGELRDIPRGRLELAPRKLPHHDDQKFHIIKDDRLFRRSQASTFVPNPTSIDKGMMTLPPSLMKRELAPRRTTLNSIDAAFANLTGAGISHRGEVVPEEILRQVEDLMNSRENAAEQGLLIDLLAKLKSNSLDKLSTRQVNIYRELYRRHMEKYGLAKKKAIRPVVEVAAPPDAILADAGAQDEAEAEAEGAEAEAEEAEGEAEEAEAEVAGAEVAEVENAGDVIDDLEEAEADDAEEAEGATGEEFSILGSIKEMILHISSGGMSKAERAEFLEEVEDSVNNDGVSLRYLAEAREAVRRANQLDAGNFRYTPTMPHIREFKYPEAADDDDDFVMGSAAALNPFGAPRQPPEEPPREEKGDPDELEGIEFIDPDIAAIEDLPVWSPEKANDEDKFIAERREVPLSLVKATQRSQMAKVAELRKIGIELGDNPYAINQYGAIFIKTENIPKALRNKKTWDALAKIGVIGDRNNNLTSSTIYNYLR